MQSVSLDALFYHRATHITSKEQPARSRNRSGFDAKTRLFGPAFANRTWVSDKFLLKTSRKSRRERVHSIPNPRISIERMQHLRGIVHRATHQPLVSGYFVRVLVLCLHNQIRTTVAVRTTVANTFHPSPFHRHPSPTFDCSTRENCQRRVFHGRLDTKYGPAATPPNRKPDEKSRR